MTEPAHAEVGAWFSSFLIRLPLHLKPTGCDLILEAGAIPVMFDQLRRWPASALAVSNACLALANLASCGSAAVKSAMRSIPDYEALLRAARASGLDACQGREWAVEALRPVCALACVCMSVCMSVFIHAC